MPLITLLFKTMRVEPKLKKWLYFVSFVSVSRPLCIAHFSSGCFCLWISKAPPATLLEKRLWHRCFPVNFAKFLRTPFFTEHLWQLLLNIVPNLKIPTNHNYDTDVLVTNDQVASALNKFRNHPSIIVTKNKRKADQCFAFGPVTYDDILKKTNNLDTAKASQQCDVPTKF